MLYPSLFDSFFAPTRVIVVSEERLKAAEHKARKEQLEALDNRIQSLSEYRTSLSNEIKALEPKRVGKDLDSMDDNTPESLEEALTGG